MTETYHLDAGAGVPVWRRVWATELLFSFGVAVLLLGPALRPGLSLVYDMVFVPDLPFSDRLLGLDGSVPRAVPSDAVVAVLSRVVPIEVLQKLVLLGILVSAGMGAARLLRAQGRTAAAVAAVFYVWNPYVGSRLLLGQWAILLALSVLPWLVIQAARLPGGGRRVASGLVLLLAVAAMSPSGGVLAAGTAVAVTALAPCTTRARLRSAGFVVISAALVNLPWLLPALLRPGGLPSAPAAVDAFAARADTSLGTVLSVLTLGGTWNSQTTPTGRAGLMAAVVLVLVLAVSAYGWMLLGRDARPQIWLRGLFLAGAGAFLVALGASLPVLHPLTRWVVTDLPGGGLFRDGTRYLPPLVLLSALGLGRGVEAIRRRAPSPRLAGVAATLGLLAPVAALSGLVWGGRGALAAARYPAEWDRARSVLAGEGDGSAVLLLPWGSYRQFRWNGSRTLYDPAGRWLPAPTVGDDRLRVGSTVVAGEDPRASALTPLVESGAPLASGLAAHGVGWVLLERTTPGADAVAANRFAGLSLRIDTAELRLWRVPYATSVPGRAPGAGWIVAADLALCFALTGASWVLLPLRGRASR